MGILLLVSLIGADMPKLDARVIALEAEQSSLKVKVSALDSRLTALEARLSPSKAEVRVNPSPSFETSARAVSAPLTRWVQRSVCNGNSCSTQWVQESVRGDENVFTSEPSFEWGSVKVRRGLFGRVKSVCKGGSCSN
jgi:hypothetical protein